MATPTLRELLERAAQRTGAGEQIFAARVIEAAQRTLRRVIGEDAARYAVARAYRKGTLAIETANPVVTAALRQHEQRILDELRTKFPHARFDRVQLLPPR